MVNCACCMRRMRYLCAPYALHIRTVVQKNTKFIGSTSKYFASTRHRHSHRPRLIPPPLYLSFLLHQMLEFFVYMFFFRADKNVGYFSCCCCCCCCSRENCAICLQVEGCFSCAHKRCVFVLRQPSSKSERSLCVLTYLKREQEDKTID